MPMDNLQPTVFDDLRGPLDPGEKYRLAAVLILIYPRAGEDYVVFMRRTDTVEHHKGQISLPGGGHEATDPHAAYTALREAHEELGVEPSSVEVLGTMPDVYAKVSSFLITPVVGRLKPGAAAGLVFKPQPTEVAEIIEVPLRLFYDEAAHHTEARTHDSVTYDIHFYNYGPYEVWGVTGRIMYQFTKRYSLSSISDLAARNGGAALHDTQG